MNVTISGLGAYSPPHVVENEALTALVETSDEWIRTRTGIERRHISRGETVLDMAEQAGRAALLDSGVPPTDIGPVIVATSTPDSYFPMAASLLRERLGMGEGPAFDLSCGCTGLMYALSAAASMMEAMGYEHALIVGSELLSRMVDWSDRATCVLFGDGAGAFVLSRGSEGILGMYINSRSDTAGALVKHALPAQNPWMEAAAAFDGSFHMNGQDVFRFAVEAVPEAILKLVDGAGITLADVDWVVPHQANLRIIKSAASRLDLPMEKFFVNMQNHGNTGAASIPIALDEMRESGLLKSGQTIAMAAFGAGFAWGGALIRWSRRG